MSSPADHYKGFMDLASAQVEGTDYRVHVRANAGIASYRKTSITC